MPITFQATAGNDNRQPLICHVDHAVSGQALTIAETHRKHGRTYCQFVTHAGDGKHIFVRKLIASMYRARWTKPLKVERVAIIAVHDRMVAA